MIKGTKLSITPILEILQKAVELPFFLLQMYYSHHRIVIHVTAFNKPAKFIEIWAILIFPGAFPRTADLFKKFALTVKNQHD
jgi:hypothetical protein